MIQVDRSRLKGEYRNEAVLMPELEEFLEKVALAKPLCQFEVHDADVRLNPSKNKEEAETVTTYTIHRIRVLENGENIGGISIEDRWREGKYEKAYGVSSFRISKERGRNDTTITKDIKVALRAVKKSFYPREHSELRDLVKEQVILEMSRQHNQLTSNLRWDMNQEAELAFYAMEAWRARQRGEKSCSMPATPVSVRDIAESDKKCEKYEQINTLFVLMNAKHGYGILGNLDNSLTVYSFANDSVSKFTSFDTLPTDIQHKYAMFKVLEEYEPVATIGMKMKDRFAFIVG